METTQSTALDPARVEHFRKQIVADRRAREKKAQDKLDQASAERLAGIEKREQIHAAGHPARLALLTEWGNELLVFSDEYKLAQDFAYTCFRRWIQSAIGPGILLNDPRVLQDQDAFNDAFAEVFKLEQVESYADATRGTVLVVGPGDTSKRWKGVAIQKLRDTDAEWKHWQHLRRELGADAPADASQVFLGGLDLSPANEQPDSALIASKSKQTLAYL